MRHLDIDFLFFFRIFLELVFPIHSQSILGLVIRLLNENLWVGRQDLSCYVFAIQRIWIVLERCLFFQICSHMIFEVQSVHDFWSAIGVVILVKPKQEMEQKNGWFSGVRLFCCNFYLEWENGVCTKVRFLANGLFTCGNFTLVFNVFSIF